MSLTSELDLFLAGLISDIRVKTKEIQNIKDQVKNIYSLEDFYPDLYMKNKKFYSNEAKFFADKAYMNLVGCDNDNINIMPYVMHYTGSELYNIHYECYISIGSFLDNGIKLFPNWKDKIIKCCFTYSSEIIDSIVFQLKDKINKDISYCLYEQEIIEEKIQLLKNINLE